MPSGSSALQVQQSNTGQALAIAHYIRMDLLGTNAGAHQVLSCQLVGTMQQAQGIFGPRLQAVPGLLMERQDDLAAHLKALLMW